MGGEGRWAMDGGGGGARHAGRLAGMIFAVTEVGDGLVLLQDGARRAHMAGLFRATPANRTTEKSS